ncbi:uncharacterized protein [Onthophagus taurus]|uniref:uncharacterized protein isoform X3 n=1 Tax=Onthophagus taurus TaxID=166361 RepID=UPI0039BE6BB3
MDMRCILLVVLLEALYPVNSELTEYQSSISSITRQNQGDIFQTEDKFCNPDVCIGLSSGTAAAVEDSKEPFCTCQCHRHLPTFREDIQICVDDINECPLAPFTGSSSSQQIPFVFLPLKGQIIHPNKEIYFPEITTPICAVSGAKFLATNGWIDLRNPSDTDVPFRLYRDEGRTFLQWEGEPVLRNRIGGRLVLVYLMCRELNSLKNQDNNGNIEGEVFARCVSFRVAGKPLKYTSSLGRHFVAPETTYSDTTESDTEVTPDILQNHEDRKKNLQITSALVHSYRHEVLNPYSSLHTLESYHQDSSSIERLPEENVSIVETLEAREDRPDNVKAIGTTRKKLYFNPAYFDPHLLQTPPPAAIEFLTKIREVITIAKQKMSAKRFTPNLLGIPEEDNFYSIETSNEYPHSLNSRRGSLISLKRENSRRKTCAGCPDCQPRDFRSLCGKLPEYPSIVACESCSGSSESKQNSIRKWLEDIPTLKIDNNEDISKSVQSLPIISSPKRIRSPTRSLPTPISINNSVKSPCSERKSPKSTTSSQNSSNSGKIKIMRKPIIKPKAPPPPLPIYAQENQYDTIKNVEKKDNLPPPDMIHEALTVEEETRIPTITKKKMNAVINEFLTKSLETNSDISKNPIDYETDSLERSSRNKGFSTPTEYGDVSSSHPSPSLSAALPMDEEMTMQNAIINTKTGAMTISKLNMNLIKNEEENDYELIVLKKGDIYNLPELLQRGNLVSEVYVNNGYNYGSAESSISSNCSTLESKPPKVRYENNKPGHLLIEVEDCADNYIRVEDSDEFEADTLDRKSNKLSSLQKEIKIDNDDYIDSLERPKQFQLKSKGSFKNDSLISIDINEGIIMTNFNRSFGSLREIYEAKTKKNPDENDINNWKDLIGDDFEGRILTLEERHSKRQRKKDIEIVNDVPPDVIPPINNDYSSPIYEHPKPPRKVIRNNSVKPPLPPKTVLKRKEIEPNYVTPIKQNENIGNKINIEEEHKEKNNTNNIKDNSILENLMQNDNIFLKNGLNNQFILQAQTFTNVPNLDVFNIPSPTWKFKNSLRKYFQKPEDSGYLSNDSDEQKKQKLLQSESEGSAGAGSETDESFGDGQSESGAESIETHSVFFDSFRKPACFTGSLDSGVDTDVKMNSFTNLMIDDAASTDSENMSFKTVVNGRRG